jgi:aminopeptidase N
MIRLSAFIVSLLLLTACGLFSRGDKFNTDTYDHVYSEEEMDGDYIDEALLEIPRYNATRTQFTDLIHTKLEVSFDWQKSWMYGKATITAKPHFYASDSLFLDAKGMEIKTVKIKGQDLKFSYNGNDLRIKLDKVYTRTDKFDIVIDYIAKPDERLTSGSAAITSDKGLYFINPTGKIPGKMPQIWTQGETESSSVWFPTIDAPNSKTTQEIFITVEDKYTTLSNGKLLTSVKNANGTRTDYWKQELPHAPYLFMMGIGEFKVVKDEYVRPNGAIMDVHYYVEPEWEPYARAIFGETPAMIKFFSQLTGVEYPWDKYHQIVVRDYVSGAMENTGAVIFGDYAYKTDRELLDENDNSTIAHELFHHWFGDLVTCESWSNLPLNESFANYSQYLWDEHRHGKDEADYNAAIEAQGYFASAGNSGHHNLIWFDYVDKELMFDAHSYNKGGRILHMLRNYLGDEAFFEGMKKYLKDNQFKPAEFHQLRLAFEEVCGEDLNWFFNQWFLGHGHPILKIEQYVSSANQEVVLTITQNQAEQQGWNLFKIPVQVAVYDDAGEHIYKAVLDKQESKLVYPISGKLKTVIFDHQQMLLAEIEDAKTEQQYLNQYYVSDRWIARRDAVLYGTVTDSPEVQKLILDALGDKHWNVRLEAVKKAVFLTNNNLTTGKNKLLDMVKNDPDSRVRSEAVVILAQELEPALLETVLKDRMQNDKSYLVISNALSAYGDSNPKEAMKVAKELEKEKSPKIKLGIAQLYSKQGTLEQRLFFEDLLNANLSGYDGIYAINYFTVYASRQDVSILAKTPAVYAEVYKNGSSYMKWIVPQNVTYMKQVLQTKIEKIEAEIAAFEKNKDVALADQARRTLPQYKKILDELTALQQENGF